MATICQAFIRSSKYSWITSVSWDIALSAVVMSLELLLDPVAANPEVNAVTCSVVIVGAQRFISGE